MNLITKTEPEKITSWDDFLINIHNQNMKKNKIIIFFILILLSFSLLGAYLYIPITTYSIYSMNINDENHGNFLELMQTSDELNLEQFLSNTIYE